MSNHQGGIAASQPITCLSSMATQHLLAEAAAAWQVAGGPTVRVESIGGVDALKRVMNGEDIDLVVLSGESVAKLMTAGRLRQGSQVDIADSHLTMAVRAGAPRPDIREEDMLRSALLSARTIGMSSGPSGTALRAQIARWNLTESLQDRIVQAPAGVSVGVLVAQGEVDLGFQQLSELIHVDGIDIVTRLPASLHTVTTFAGAVGATSRHHDAARAFLSRLCAPASDALRQRHGLQRAASNLAVPTTDQPKELRA